MIKRIELLHIFKIKLSASGVISICSCVLIFLTIFFKIFVPRGFILMSVHRD